jgi:two-component system, NtrC family, C4-dicarboxylate transport response regulator DctD
MSQRILLVDDDAATLLALSDLFRRHLPDVILQTARNAESALALMAPGRFDLIISDVRMPGLTGIDFLRLVKADYPGTVVILFSGYETGVGVQAMQLGAYAFLEKPLIAGELIPLVRSAMEEARKVVEANRSPAPVL